MTEVQTIAKAIIEEYKKNYPNKIKAYNKQNGGLSDARNFDYNIQQETM